MADTAPKKPKAAPKKPVAQKATTQKKANNGFAVIETGGKQYRVAEGDVIKIEKTNSKEGDKVTFDKVLMTGSGDSINLGFPLIDKATVEGEVVKNGRNKKVLVMKYKAKSNYFKKYGHRQPYQMVRVTKI